MVALLALSRLAAQHGEIMHLRSPQQSPEPPPPAKLDGGPGRASHANPASRSAESRLQLAPL
ncbi:hypothetical protein [Streptomyces sp. NPDC097610]|uniref:hypothetical protein n=1 Tax=Streptomyces sp. NPDC097610 TaxID=3157227 RepID=UPI003321B49F